MHAPAFLLATLSSLTSFTTLSAFNDHRVDTINYGHLKSNDAYIKQSEEQKLLHTLENSGFFILTNHNMDHTIMDTTWNDTKLFFDSSIENKQNVLMTAGVMFGYSATETLSATDGYNTNDPSNTFDKDNKELFQVFINDETQVIWPEYPINFKNSWIKYHEQSQILAKGLLSSIATVLALPTDYFEDKMQTDHMSCVRGINYPKISLNISSSSDISSYLQHSRRCSEHSDWGPLTFLRQDSVGGLQIERKSSSDTTEWINVRSDFYDLVVNTGDTMQRWTNDRFISPRHRVVYSALDRRQSIAYFVNLRKDAMIETIPSCLDENGGSKYSNIKFIEFFESRFNGTISFLETEQSAKHEL